jgi:glycosyltransferase involved in cell wall biosynthesis
MRRVLLVAYHFPPSVDAGAKRALGFFRHLPEHGWEPTVLTVRDGNYATVGEQALGDEDRVVRVPEERYAWQRDAPAGRAESAGRAAGREPGLLRRLARSALYVPDPWRGFHRPAAEAARRLHAERAFDSVWTTSAPWTSLRIGSALRAAGVPWVADLRDLWLRNWHGYPHGPLRRAVDAHLERRWLSRASALTAASEGQAALLRRDAFGPPVTAVRNGFLEAADARPPERPDDRFRIVFAGKLYAHADLSSQPLFDLLARWRAEAPEELARVRVDLYGRADPGFEERRDESGLRDVVRHHGLVSPERAAEELRRADAILGVSPRRHREIVPTKTYDALGALVPMLLIAPPDGEAAAILRDVRGGAAFAAGDTSGAVGWLRERLRAGREDESTRADRLRRVARYSYAALAGELAGVLSSVVR